MLNPEIPFKGVVAAVTVAEIAPVARSAHFLGPRVAHLLEARNAARDRVELKGVGYP